MPRSILDAVKLGYWDYEPPETAPDEYQASDAMPGTREKLEVMADRLAKGLPLWHENDRENMDLPGVHSGPR